MIIKLHSNGKPVYFNVDNIVGFTIRTSERTYVGNYVDETIVFTTGHCDELVDETPEIIAEMINSHA